MFKKKNNHNGLPVGNLILMRMPLVLKVIVYKPKVMDK